MAIRNWASLMLPDRIAPGTAVAWYVGFVRHTGRVKHNIPGVGSKPGSVVVKDVNGDRVVLGLRTVSIVKAAG